MRARKVLRFVLALTALLCVIAAVWFGYSYYRTLEEYKRGNADLNSLYEKMGGIPAPMDPKAEAAMDGKELEAVREQAERIRLESYRKLAEENSDVIGWVRIEGTVVDYPVMHTPDKPDYYLKRGFDQEYSAYGMVYLDGACWIGEGCPNYLLYGHHMKNGSMFASLEGYAEKEYYKAHPVIGFDTLEEIADYEVAGAFKIGAGEINREFAKMLAARTEEDYKRLVAYMKENSFYDTGIVPEWPQQLITLTTCEYTEGDGRFLVVARRVEK